MKNEMGDHSGTYGRGTGKLYKVFLQKYKEMEVRREWEDNIKLDDKLIE
jgi:hypothetical protein